MASDPSITNLVVVPEDNDLYRAVNPNPKSSHFRSDGTLSSTLFSNTNKTDSMLVDWSAKTTPLETRDRNINWSVDFVVAITAGLCYELGQTVEPKSIDEWDYTRTPPRPPNPAHCNVTGKKNLKTKEMFLERCRKIMV